VVQHPDAAVAELDRLSTQRLFEQTDLSSGSRSHESTGPLDSRYDDERDAWLRRISKRERSAKPNNESSAKTIKAKMTPLGGRTQAITTSLPQTTNQSFRSRKHDVEFGRDQSQNNSMVHPDSNFDSLMDTSQPTLYKQHHRLTGFKNGFSTNTQP